VAFRYGKPSNVAYLMLQRKKNGSRGKKGREEKGKGKKEKTTRRETTESEVSWGRTTKGLIGGRWKGPAVERKKNVLVN